MPERQSRRLAAILAADIAGYSALMGADEVRTVRDLKGHQAVILPMIAEFAGRDDKQHLVQAVPPQQARNKRRRRGVRTGLRAVRTWSPPMNFGY
jgi:hypothetical protein